MFATEAVFSLHCERRMDAERFTSAYRLALGITLIYVLFWMLVPEALKFSRLVSTAPRSQRETATRPPQTVNAPGPKLSAASLESALLQTTKLGKDPQVRCEPAGQLWDYVCTYLPSPRQSTTRLQFGVNVDATRWVKVSGMVAMGDALPPPQ
jgi:hypothetical protein